MKTFNIYRLLCLVAVITLSAQSYADGKMNQKKMENTVKQMATKSEGQPGFLQFDYQGLSLYLISDVKHDRMRIITPIAEYKNLGAEHIEAMMISNFHLALDARYAVSDGVVYSAYIHPLSELSEHQIQSAVKQVANLARSFGSGYTSGELSFGGGEKSETQH